MNILELIIFILPAYVANCLPVIFGGGTPIDFGARFTDGKRVLGDGKTIRGFAAGLLGGIVVTWLLSGYAAHLFLPALDAGKQLSVGAALAIGALTGDCLGSFIKRRLSLPRGHPTLLLDQLPFLFVALAFAFAAAPQLVEAVSLPSFAFLTILTIVAHIAANRIGYVLKLKEVPW